ncbi:hypothetical protein EMN47_01665 [Prolixibacteraceae bacterium JC049]|nr:hypothetical protein [Prolixibacteraceae bacterium JC049]
MKLSLLFFLAIITTTTMAQKKRFQGRLINDIGQPIKDAYVINYRNYHHVTSKKDGSFRIYVLPGDSLCISHISYKRTIIHPSRNDTLTTLPWETHTISSLYTEAPDSIVNISTWKFTYDSTNYHFQSDANTYAPGSNEVGFGVNVFEAFKAISKIGKKRKAKKLKEYRDRYKIFLEDSLWRVGDLNLLAQIDSIAYSKSYKQLKKHCRE